MKTYRSICIALVLISFSSSGYAFPLSASYPRIPVTSDRTYYVDFAKGNNANSGTSPSQAWKHAPGDTAATQAPAAKALLPGDIIRFRGGVPYRGSITFKQSGDAANPIIYSGAGFGAGQAILDGADDVMSSVPCSSAVVCGGASNWESLRLVTYSEPGIKYRKLYDAAGPLYESQAPAVSDPFWDDDISQFTTIPLSHAAAVEAGRLESAVLAEAAAGQQNARVAIWAYGNMVKEMAITSVSGNTIYFNPAGLTVYKDRDGKAAIVGSVKSVTKPGLYAVLGPGRAVVYPRAGGGTKLYVGNGRYSFNLGGKSNIVIQGFQFVRGTGSSGTTREGVGIANYGSAVSNIRIENNSFSNYSMQNGYGMVMLNNVTNLTVSNNRLTNIEGGSGFRFGDSVSNLIVQNNVMRRIGRTGMYLQGVDTANVSGNILSDLSGIHGNGMSFYLGNQDVTVSGNCVFEALRAMTYHGDKSGTFVNNLRFTGNIFIAAASGTSAVHAWGAKARGVVLDNNVALGRKAGFILNAVDLEITATRNRTAGILFSGAQSAPSGWTVQNNDNSAKFEDKDQAVLSENSCSARGTQGLLRIVSQS